MKNKLLSAVLLTTSLYASNSVDININNDTLEVGAELYLNNKYNLNNSSNYYFIANYLHNEGDDNEPNKSLSTLGFKVMNPYTDDNGISLGLGIKSTYTSQLDKSFIAIPLSVYVRYELNEMIYFNFEYGYAPSVLTYQDGEKFQDIKFKANYKVLDDGYIYAGIRDIRTTYEPDLEVEYDTSAFVGFNVRF